MIEVKNAFKKYKSKSDHQVVLNGLNMEVHQGEIYSLMGSSGCGKTTLINCIVGVQQLDKGEISTFGGNFNSSRSGYMPQNTALVRNLKIREIFWFFGLIFGLTSEKIEEKLRFLSELLELPESSRMVKNCSGGQQRRISFAVTLMHEPDLLILDEPTVGVDPLLRDRIWTYLIRLTREKNVSVLLSTHYIEEAKQSDKIGLMRNGVMIAEGSPQSIMQMCDSADIEEAFLKLSQRQENSRGSSEVSKYLLTESVKDPPKFIEKITNDHGDHKNRRPMKALLGKHFTEFSRNYGLLTMVLVLPIVNCIGIYFGIGNRLNDLTLGVVNDEISSSIQCFNESLKTFEVNRFECFLTATSCRFIHDFDETSAKLKYYDSYEKAFEDAKRTKIIGFIHFASNFTELLPLFNDEVEDDFSDNGMIQVYLDNTNMQSMEMVKKEVYDTYQRFIERIMVDCGKSKTSGSSPIVFETLYGKVDFSLMKTINLGLILTIVYFYTAILMSTSIIDERSSGVWNRAIVAGVQPNQFIFSHLIEGLLVVFVQLIFMCHFMCIFLSDTKTFNAIFLQSLILFLCGIFGIVFGIFSSIVCQTVVTSIYFNQFFIYPAFFVCGAFWPMEGQPSILRRIGYLFPFSYPMVAMRSIAFKDSTISHRDVQMAFIVLLVWITSLKFLSLKFLKRH